MIASLRRRPALLGALLSTQAQGTYYGTYVGPSYDLLDKLHVNVNTLLVSRSDFQAKLDGLYADLARMDNQLTQLDSTNETQWTAEMQALQGRLNEFYTRVERAQKSQAWGWPLLAGVVAGGVSWAFMKRIPRVRRRYYTAGAGLAGAGLAHLWWRNRR